MAFLVNLALSRIWGVTVDYEKKAKERAKALRKKAYQEQKQRRKEYEATPEFQAKKQAYKEKQRQLRQKAYRDAKIQQKKSEEGTKQKKEVLSFESLKLVKEDKTTGEWVPMKTPPPRLTLIVSDGEDSGQGGENF